jgi:NADH:ubiquinone oxidoreductase subunit 6 (subunit J)
MRSFLLSAGVGLAVAVGLTGVLAILVYVFIVAVWISALDSSIRVNRQEKVKPVGEKRQLT